MHTTFLLIRHGATSFLGNALSGRTPGVHLNEEGLTQAKELAERLANVEISHIYSSPLERATETAEPLAKSRNLPIEVNEHLSEIDFGTWAGKTLQELEPDPAWKRFNRFRSGTRAPDGESMLSVQYRITREMERLRQQHPGENVALFSHSDAIKAAVLFYLGIPMDFFLRLAINPASVSVLTLSEHGVHVLRLNDDGPLHLPIVL